ncbi:MAG: (NiFe) hydrogenase maturation protein HypF [Acidimicrobiaceae bacterium]|jgi:hydrogenase maturation protein HypF|nr:(NiFe) hydrogenase maturation protein HypF [Acidimicrobiaceae bacterium]
MTAPTTSSATLRHRVRVAGVVQGVGFRPFVHRLATELDLAGHVGNDAEGVFVEVEGPTHDVERFEARLIAEAPPLAVIRDVEALPIETRGERGFQIVDSRSAGPVRTFVSPDVAVCSDCLQDLCDPDNRRYRYPFVNCTNCGPRFTITVRLPYDRPNTTMRGFGLCADCAREYRDPRDRRFHAEPIACAACGPRISFEGPRGGAVHGTDAAIAATQAAFARGEIVAVKGIGGYHLACDATSRFALQRLRRRKGRAEKPFAVMVRDLAVAEELAVIDASEATLLTGYQRPIVLLRQRAPSPLSPLVAPGNPYVGVLLAYTPLHHLLFDAAPGADGPAPRMLVMTSGNLGDEPICYEDGDARRRLVDIADAWLVHDRPIHVPCDDSVVRIESGEELPIRRSRGYAPLSVRLTFDSDPLVAVGGELKNTFCLASGRDAWMSQHVGDMGSVETLSAFERSTRQFAQIYEVGPERLAADGHPGYQTRRWAERHADRPVALVQHHHAHIASLMVEHQVPLGEQVLGYAFDGTGYGTDGAIWGGEVLVADYNGFVRAAHLRYVGLPGGDSVIRRPYRAALAYLRAAGIEWIAGMSCVDAASSRELAVIERQLERGFQCVPTSSMGRLFDAVSSLLGLRHIVSYEAQAAIELEAAAADHLRVAREYEFEIAGDEFDPSPVLRAIADDLRAGRAIGAIAAGFHLAVARLIGDSAERLRRETGIERVGLSGGVFQNVVLVRLARAELVGRGFSVLTHRLVPPNDGGLALGQAAVAGRRGPESWEEKG